MKTNLYIVIFTLIGIACAPQLSLADDKFPNTPYEDGRETNTQNIILPSAVGGTLVLRGCEQCKHGSLMVTSDSKFFLDSAPISLKDLNAFLRKGSSHFAMVYSKADSSNLSRVVIYSNNSPRSGTK